MAIHAHSTTAPARPLLPLAFRPSAPVDDPRTADELLAEIAAEIDRQAGKPELPPEPLLPAQNALSNATRLSDQAYHDKLATSDHDKSFDKGAYAHLSEARAIHLRRQLEAAAEHGADLLSALGLPRLVDAGFIQVDPAAAGDALDHAIATLDALDMDPDVEDGADDEFTGDDELSLGWRERVGQLDLGHGQDDGEPTLGAPERSPYTPPMGASFYKPANGRRLQRCFVTRAWNQVEWAAGSWEDGEGEPEPGYDLPEGDDELCGSEHDGCEPEEQEHSLGSAAGDGNQEHWAQGSGGAGEAVNEDGEDGGGWFPPAARPTSPRRPDPMGFRLADERRAIARRARDAKAIRQTGAPRDPDTLTIYRDGRAYWSGPYVTRDGIPVIGCAS